MFTGLVQEVGQIIGMEERDGKRTITVAAKRVTQGIGIGGSIAVSGVCLTIIDSAPAYFRADLAAETWARTSFSRLAENSLVNLELPLSANGRMDGHMMQGHVDGTGRFLGLEPIPGAQDFWLHIETPAALDKYLVFKGSIAVEGISLTIAELNGNRATMAIIPHTSEMTNLSSLRPGDSVNIEVDVVAKYLEKWIGGACSQTGMVETAKGPESVKARLSAVNCRGRHFGVVAARFNLFVTERLVQGALRALDLAEVSRDSVELI